MSIQKTIIFCAPADLGFSDIMVDALRKRGFKVYAIPFQYKKFRYKNWLERLYNAFRKVVFRDYDYKNKLKMREIDRSLQPKLKQVPYADFALIIRPDLFPLSFVRSIKAKTKKLVGYQWDGLQRFPKVKDYVSLFDRFFVFDAQDLDFQEGLLPLTNFHLERSTRGADEHSVYFIGRYDDYRFELVKQIKSFFDRERIDSRLLFLPKDEKEASNLTNHGFDVGRPITYEENLRLADKSSILLDIHSPIHTGLSLRVFEAMDFNKKLITTNDAIRNYDFYHPNNIFVWDGSNEEDIVDFLHEEFIPIPQDIRNKYGFTNWIRYVLDTGEYTPIDLPTKGMNRLQTYDHWYAEAVH